VVGSLRKLEGLTVVVFGRVFFLGGTFLSSMWSWLLEWETGSGFGMIIGVGVFRLKLCFQCSFLVLPQGMLPLLLACLVLVGTELGI
jgi:hypothetical protein